MRLIIYYPYGDDYIVVIHREEEQGKPYIVRADSLRLKRIARAVESLIEQGKEWRIPEFPSSDTFAIYI